VLQPALQLNDLAGRLNLFVFVHPSQHRMLGFNKVLTEQGLTATAPPAWLLGRS
jgi:hypothetical protein